MPMALMLSFLLAFLVGTWLSGDGEVGRGGWLGVLVLWRKTSRFERHRVGNDKGLHALYLAWKLREPGSAP